MCDPIWKGSRDREVAAEQVLLINLDDVEDGIKELERSARLGLGGAMNTEYPSSTGAMTNPSTSRSGPPPRRSTCH